MITPVKGTQVDAGQALYAGGPAIVKWTTGSTEEEVYIDLGFTPSIAFMIDTTTVNTYMYYDGMVATKALLLDDGSLVAAAGFTKWANTVVPTGKFYIRANVVNTSAAGADDVCTGLLIDDGVTAVNAVNYLIAFP